MSNFNFSIALVFVVVMFRLANAKEIKVLKRRQNAIVPLVGSENFYVKMKKEIPVTYVDDGQLGHLRDYDYSKSHIDYAKYNKLSSPLTQQIPTERGQSVDLKAKSIICSFIFDSPFFKARGEVAVNYDLTQIETMNELRKNKRDTYDDIYANYPDAHGQWLNPYKRRLVSVDGERFEEHTFRCLARRRDSKTAAGDSFVDYFVSPIYQSKNRRDLMMNGRFVFTSNDNDELILFATAEERLSKLSGFTYVRGVHQYYYHENRGFDEHPKPDKSINELCVLPVRDKIRLCDDVINLRNFPDKVTFLPSEANVKRECEEIKVSEEVIEYQHSPRFRDTMRQIPTAVNITYDQWMVGCKVVGTDEDDLRESSSWYYISVGLEEHSVLVFKESTTKNLYEGLIGVERVRWVESGSDVISYNVTDKIVLSS